MSPLRTLTLNRERRSGTWLRRSHNKKSDAFSSPLSTSRKLISLELRSASLKMESGPNVTPQRILRGNSVTVSKSRWSPTKQGIRSTSRRSRMTSECYLIGRSRMPRCLRIRRKKVHCEMVAGRRTSTSWFPLRTRSRSPTTSLTSSRMTPTSSLKSILITWRTLS